MHFSDKLRTRRAREANSFVPYIDVVMFLLFYAVAASLGGQHVMNDRRPEVPSASAQSAAPTDLPVLVRQNGTYQIGEDEIAPDQIETRIRDTHSRHANLIVFIDGDRQAPYGRVITLEDICNRHDIRYRHVVNEAATP
jgi:biopolymer transport protein ExbD